MKIQIRNWKSREEIEITFLIVRHKKGNEHADWSNHRSICLTVKISSRLDNK